MVLDLKNPEGAAALRRMLVSADVLLYSLRAKAMERLGLSYAAVREINPRIIYCGAFGFGQRGPYADRPAYDDLIQAAVGMPVLQSRRSGPPAYVATSIADRVVGMATSNAVAMALFHRERTGVGRSVSVPMYKLQGDGKPAVSTPSSNAAAPAKLKCRIPSF
jgi:crotonobetainyl-CoA:carnitine CoA-transferase CaiB-like acyl-CoA transferase